MIKIPQSALPVLAVLALTLALAACDKPDVAQTPGQKLDSAIAQTQQSAEEAQRKAEASGAQMKEKTEESFARAGEALKDATQHAEASAKAAAGKAIEKIDDMAITTAISAALAKDPDIRLLKINVDTRDGAVTLKGSVPTQAAQDRAAALARSFSGVQSVDNQLVVQAN